jgi:hypothetical protein
MLLLLVRRHGSPRVPAGATAAACIWARETERARVVSAHAWARAASERDGCGAMELRASGAGVGAPSDASAPDGTSRACKYDK